VRALAKVSPGPGHVELAERPEPRDLPDHVVLQVVGGGICGTDLHIFDDEFPSEPPVTMGHEVSGVVLRLGDGVDQSWQGARVVSETYFSTCGVCDYCRGGRPNLCLDRRSIGSRVDGAFAPRVTVPVRNLHRIPDWLDGHAASLTEPLACVCNCLLDPQLACKGDVALVVGPGPIGLLAGQVAAACGAHVHVHGIERDRERLACACKLGFDTSVEGVNEPPDAADVVIECSGSPAGIALALQSARRGGRFVQIGLAGKAVTIPLDEVCFRELTVTSGNASTSISWRRAVELIESRQVVLEPLVTEVVPLDEWERAFAAIREGRGIKYVLDPSE
jgi:L-iditol 2-dehydrogenase